MEIRKSNPSELDIIISGIQESFQNGFEAYFGKTNQMVIPKKDILESYNKKGAKTFVAVENEKIIGGVIVVIDEVTNINYLDILYVDTKYQNKGIGYKLWSKMEELFPNTKIWKTCTPYFDKRNVAFYLNKCKFHAVKFIIEDENAPDDFIGDGGFGMFEFEKNM